MKIPLLAALLLSILPTVPAQEPASPTGPITRGQRIYASHHSFFAPIPPILTEVAKSGGFPDQKIVGTDFIAGSKALAHWVLPDAANPAKKALRTGQVDVLILTPAYLPDEGLLDFTKFGLGYNRNIRVAIMEIWLPYDVYNPVIFDSKYKGIPGEPPLMPKPAKVDHNAATAEQLRKMHEYYFRTMDDQVREIDRTVGPGVVFVVPVGQAVLALREKVIAGQAPGLKVQEDLFRDEPGHPKPPLQVLETYCYYAAIYRKSPVGLPVPSTLAASGIPADQVGPLNRLLQELAWDAVIHHPLSGVKPGQDDSLAMKSRDEVFMRRALELARLGLGLTLPNPRVGAVLVRGGKIIGEGHHRRAGGPHAEVLAVAEAKKRGRTVAGATLYVTLEPCSTHGRTPPCTGLIVREKIGRVVFAATDPNPAHAGAARRLLRSAGVEVSSGFLAEEAAALNRDFNWWIARRRPWVTAKIALSLDGRITAPEGDARWLTSPAARRAAHELRWEADAILVGGETARRDDPRLTVRLPGRRGKEQPWRVVVTRSGKFSRSLHLFSDRHRDRTLVFKNQPLADVVGALGAMEVSHLLIEGGGEILSEAFRAGLVNEAAFFIAPSVTGTQPRALQRLPAPLRLREVGYQTVGPDLLCRGLL